MKITLQRADTGNGEIYTKRSKDAEAEAIRRCVSESGKPLHNALVLWLFLSSHSQKTPEISVTYKFCASYCGFTRSDFSKASKALEQIGYLVSNGKGGYIFRESLENVSVTATNENAGEDAKKGNVSVTATEMFPSQQQNVSVTATDNITKYNKEYSSSYEEDESNPDHAEDPEAEEKFLANAEERLLPLVRDELNKRRAENGFPALTEEELNEWRQCFIRLQRAGRGRELRPALEYALHDYGFWSKPGKGVGDTPGGFERNIAKIIEDAAKAKGEGK